MVAYALAGNMKVDLYHDPLGQDQDGVLTGFQSAEAFEGADEVGQLADLRVAELGGEDGHRRAGHRAGGGRVEAPALAADVNEVLRDPELVREASRWVLYVVRDPAARWKRRRSPGSDMIAKAHPRPGTL